MSPAYATSQGQAYETTNKVQEHMKSTSDCKLGILLVVWLLNANVIKVCTSFANIIVAVHLT